jgi:hypothetical protein
MRPFLLVSAAIVVLGGAAFGFIAWTSRTVGDAPPPPSMAAPAPVAPPVEPAAAAAPAPAVQAIIPSAVPPPPVVMGPPRKQVPPGSWEAVPVTARASGLGPAGAAVGRELAELHPRISACFDEMTQARLAPERFTTVKDEAPMDDNGVTVLMLQLETGQDEVRIVDAPLETAGGNADGLVVCVQRVLRGRVIAAPGTPPGRKHRMPYTVLQ